jgi:hypothetical protein
VCPLEDRWAVHVGDVVWQADNDVHSDFSMTCFGFDTYAVVCG